MSIAVIGQGFVGGSLTTVFSERGETVYVYDKAGKTGFRRASSVGKCPPIELWYNAGRESWVNDPSWVGRVPESRLEWK